ncbi:MAG: MGMT family protein [Candidatus Hydrogenedentota bacterium]|nr:MAG: MGMT family protein [Candidatus Hydrogenedentota bacterium]
MNKDYYEKIYELVKKIPKGRVSTYGNIAEALSMKSAARTVGYALNAAKNRPEIPCHRVVNRKGELTGKHHFPDEHYMKDKLQSEGVTFDGERVNLEKHFFDLRKL